MTDKPNLADVRRVANERQNYSLLRRLVTDDAADAVPALLAAVDAVLALHRPSPRWVFARDEHVTICETCTNTEVARSRAVMWPCPTVRAITAHLDIEEQR